MRSNVRASLLLALALVACSDDNKKRTRGRDGDGDAPGAPGGRDGSDDDEAPNGAVEPMSPACEALHGDTVFQSEGFATVVTDARASAEGHVLLLLDEQAGVDAPVETALRLVRTPEGPSQRDVALTGNVLALSDPRAGRVLLVQGGSEIFGPASIDALDLASATVTASQPLEDRSEQPRVYYDDAGQVAHQVASRALTVVRHGVQLGSVRAVQLGDGGHAVLTFVVDPLPTQGYAVGVWLFVLEADGRLRARVPIKTHRNGLLGGVSLQRGPDDRLHVLASLHRSERAGFERIHARTLKTPDFERLPVVLTFSPAGALEAVHETAPSECPAPLNATASALDADAAGLAWSGGCGEAGAWLATVAATPAAPVAITPLALGVSPDVGSLLRHASGAVYLAGARNYTQVETGSVTAPGDAVLVRIEPDGIASLTCPYDTPRNDRFTLRRSERSLMILQYDAGITHSSGEDYRAQSVVRYVAP